ncbi:hypothetical protein ACFWUZ_28595 [Streptomyces sp. NPDC058646]|uniref:hypothetical protein n=1 Tax=Streptomyces sp. NPDC058646 TaxID=3346574 RepID=UPI00365EF499
MTESFEDGPHLVRGKDVKWLDPAGYARWVDVGLRGLGLRALREDNGRLRERVAVYAQVIHELRAELDRRTDNNTQRLPVRSLPTSIT